MLVAGVSWIVARVMERRIVMRGQLLLSSVALVPLAYGISTLATGATGASLVGNGIEQDAVAAVCIAFASFALTAVLLTERLLITWAIRALLAGLAVAFAVQTAHLLFPSLFGGVLAGQSANPVGTWHEFSILFGFSAVLGVALFTAARDHSRGWRIAYLVATVLSALILFVVNFSDVWIAVLVGSSAVALVGIFERLRAGDRLRAAAIHVIPALVIVAIAAGYVAFGATAQSLLPQQFQVTTVEVRPSWSGTYAIGSQALSRPVALLFGSGPNTFTQQWQLFKPAEVNQTLFWDTAFSSGIGTIPTALITTGLVGGLAWLVYLTALFTTFGASLLHKGERLPEISALAIGAIFLFAFHVLYPPGPALGALAFMFSGLAAAAALWHAPPRTADTGRGSWVQKAVAVALAAFIGVALLASVLLTRTLVAEILVNKAVYEYNQSNDLAKASATLRSSLRIYPGSDRAQRAAVELGLLKLQALTQDPSASTEAARAQLQATLNETITHGLSAVTIDGGDYQNWLSLATVYAQLAGVQVEGALDRAREAYTRARDANPTNPVPYLNLARLDLLKGDHVGALRNLQRAVQLKPDFAAAYYLSSQVYASQNDLASAYSSAVTAAQYAKSEPLAWYNLSVIAFASERYDEAIFAGDNALSLQPQYASALYITGLGYYAKGDLVRAREYIEALLQIDPSNAAVNELASYVGNKKSYEEYRKRAEKK